MKDSNFMKDIRLNRNPFLEASYSELDYKYGDLVEVDDTGGLSKNDLLNKGHWIELCQSLSGEKNYKAEKILFVDDNPVIVFVDSDESMEKDLHKIFNSIWCMARPRLLFLATPGEIGVYDLSHSPYESTKDLRKKRFRNS